MINRLHCTAAGSIGFAGTAMTNDSTYTGALFTVTFTVKNTAKPNSGLTLTVDPGSIKNLAGDDSSVLGTPEVDEGTVSVDTSSVSDLNLQVSNLSGAVGEEKTVIVSLTKNPGLSQVGLILNYDAAKLQYVSYTGGNIFSLLNVVTNPTDGKGGFAGGGTTNSQVIGALFTVTFRLKAQVCASLTLDVDKAKSTTGDLSIYATPGTVTVTPATKTLTGIPVKTSPTKTIYTAGEVFNPAGLTLTATWSDTTTTIITSGFEFPTAPLKTTDKTVTITYQGKTAQHAITVKEAEATKSNNANLASITLLGETITNPSTSITRNVANSVTSATITAVLADSKASVTGTGAFALSVGANTRQLVVTAEDGVTKKTYTVTINRAAPGDVVDPIVPPYYPGGTYTPSTGGSTGSTSTSTGSFVNKSGSVNSANVLAYIEKSKANPVIVTIKNATSISKSTLKKIADKAAEKGVAVKFYIDTTDAKGKTLIRQYIDPIALAKLGKDVRLGGTLSGDTLAKVKAKFEKAFGPSIAIVSLNQKSNFGVSFETAARVDLSALNTKSLYLYSYDIKTNKYARINVKTAVDKNGFLHFTTSVGGEILISDKPLKK